MIGWLVAAACGPGNSVPDETSGTTEISTSVSPGTSDASSSSEDVTGSGTSGTEEVDGSSGDVPGYQPDVAWTFPFGALQDQVATGVRPLPDGGIAFIGTTEDAVDLGDGPLDPLSGALLAVLDGDGQLQWSMELQGRAALAVTATGELVVAEGMGNAGDSALRKLDASGAELWSRPYGPDNVSLEDVDVDADGNIVLAGWFSQTLDLGDGVVMSGGAADGFVAKLDPEGAPIWVRTTGGADGEYTNEVEPAGDGGVVIAGHFLTTVDLGGGVLSGEDGNFVAKLDLDGAHAWSEGIEFAGWEVHGLALDGAGAAVLLTGSVLASGGLAKYDAAGALAWSTSPDVSTPYALTAAPDGTLYVGGIGSLHAWTLVRLDPDGMLQWSWDVLGEGPGHDSDGVAAMTLDADGNLLVAGWFSGTADFGTGPLTPAGDRDGIVLKIIAP